MTNKIELGWAAPTIKKQFPQLDEKDADHFQRDHEDLSRLKIRGIINATEHKNAVRRFANKVAKAIAEKRQ